MLEVDLHFNDKLKAISSAYAGDMLTSGSEIHYGVHFLCAPPIIKPGDHVTIQLTLRTYPKDSCDVFQVGTNAFLKEGSQTRAEGVIKRRGEHQSQAETIATLYNEFGCKL